MKRVLTLAMTLLLGMSLLTACGGSGKQEETNVDLTAYFTQMMKDAGFDESYMTDLERCWIVTIRVSARSPQSNFWPRHP